MSSADRSLMKLVGAVRRQFYVRAMRQHLAVCCAVLFAGGLVVLWAYPWLVDWMRWMALGLALVVPTGLFWLLQRRTRGLSNAQVAMFVEECNPKLEDRLNSALEVRSSAAENAALAAALLQDASQKIAPILPRKLLQRIRSRLWMGTSLVAVATCLVLGVSNLDRLQAGSAERALVRNPYMTISPGNTEVDQGDAVSIVATLRESGREDVTLVYQEEGGEWTHELMVAGRQGNSFLAEVLDIQRNITYYVEAGRHRSDPFVVSVYEFPEVQQIDVTYEAPAYSNLPIRTEEDEGDIEGLKGSRVTVNVRTNTQAKAAAMVLESGQEVPLSRVADGQFRGRMELETPDRYVLRLLDESERQNRFPREYLITPIEDLPPRITLQEPGRDLRANAIQEVLIAADVSDDYAIDSFDLMYSVNGDDEVAVNLLTTPGETSITGEHLLFLEDFSLQPGDVITYYIEATDALQSEFTDMFFIEVVPFEQQFTQLANAGGGQAGMPQQSGLVISQQDIIAATWRLLREEEEISDFDEALEALIQAQRNLQANIEERLNTTAFSLELRGSEEQQQVAEHLRNAVSEMSEAVRELEARRLRDALTPERRALNQLLRADAFNTERQVARQQQQRGMGGGAAATEERMTELMDLELDISRDKYETQQQRPAAANSAEDNDALRRVRDLAQRQQDLAQQRQAESEEDQRRFVDRLRREQEELQRTLESMQGQMQQSSQQAQEDLSRALRNMQQAQRALRRGNMDEAAARQQQAANDLQALEEALRLQARGSDREAVTELAQNLDALIERELELAEDLNEASDRPTREELQRLSNERADILEDLERVIEQAESLEEADSDAATAARNLTREFHRSAIREDMQNSDQALRNGWMPTARRIEEEITSDLESLEAARRELTEALPLTQEESLARSIDDLQRLQSEIRELETQAERMRESGGGTPAQQARLEMQMQRVQQAARDLASGMDDMQSPQQAAAGVQNALTRADHTGVLLDEESANDFFGRSVYTPLSALEVQLRQALESIQLEAKLYGSRRGEVPPEYVDMVEKYYESLSSRRSQ